MQTFGAGMLRGKRGLAMSHRISARPDVETPIERIFEKVMHRKMTVAERKALHLKAGGGSRHFEKSIHGAALLSSWREIDLSLAPSYTGPWRSRRFGGAPCCIPIRETYRGPSRHPQRCPHAHRKISGRPRLAFRHATGRESRRRSGSPRGHRTEAVDEIIMGNVVQAGLGQNPARQAGLGGGLMCASRP